MNALRTAASLLPNGGVTKIDDAASKATVTFFLFSLGGRGRSRKRKPGRRPFEPPPRFLGR
jgi:hypothetical protein